MTVLLKGGHTQSAIAHWRDQRTDGRINLAALHGWPVREHGYAASLKSVQRCWRRTFPAPAIRARRRVETPAGAQAQVDWAEYPGMVLGGEVVDLVALAMTLSWSRKRAVVWARAKDMLSWQACHTACFRRLGGVTAVLRIDNVKTGVSRGAGSWGEVNPADRRYAVPLKFHVDACQPRQPRRPRASACPRACEGRAGHRRPAGGGRSPRPGVRRPRSAAGVDRRAGRGPRPSAALPGDRDQRGRGVGERAGAADAAARDAARAVRRGRPPGGGRPRPRRAAAGPQGLRGDRRSSAWRRRG